MAEDHRGSSQDGTGNDMITFTSPVRLVLSGSISFFWAKLLAAVGLCWWLLRNIRGLLRWLRHCGQALWLTLRMKLGQCGQAGG